MYDYLIVGSGLFGSTFAYEMNKAGRRCLIIESKNHLYLNHLHRCDFGLMFKRHEVRSKWNQKQDGGGNHNRTSDIEVLKRYFNDIPTKIEIIPEEHKVHLYGI